jgi:hypothetical protein
MSDYQPVHDMLGHAAPDAGCDACFRLMDEVAEAQGAGMDISAASPRSPPTCATARRAARTSRVSSPTSKTTPTVDRRRGAGDATIA